MKICYWWWTSHRVEWKTEKGMFHFIFHFQFGQVQAIVIFLRIRNLACITACLQRQTTPKLQFSALFYVFKTLIVAPKSSPTGLSKLCVHHMSCSINNQFFYQPEILSVINPCFRLVFLCWLTSLVVLREEKNSLLSWQFSSISNHGWNGTHITSELIPFTFDQKANTGSWSQRFSLLTMH